MFLSAYVSEVQKGDDFGIVHGKSVLPTMTIILIGTNSAERIEILQENQNLTTVPLFHYIKLNETSNGRLNQVRLIFLLVGLLTVGSV